MAPPILILRDIALTFGGTALLKGAGITVSRGERLCLVGRNGSGKSTLLKIAAGLIEGDAGEVFLQPGTTICYLPQEPELREYSTTSDYVNAGLGPNDDFYRGGYLLEQLGLDGSENTSVLSGGQIRRAALARVLAPQPDILLLDEPTNHLDLPAIEWLEKELKSMRSAIVLISHDRRFLENLSQATIWLSQGSVKRFDQGFAHFEAWRDKIIKLEELDRHKLDRKLVAENYWFLHGVSARRKRNQRRLRALKNLRQQRREQYQDTGGVKMSISESDASGKLVGEAKRLSKSYGNICIVSEFSLRIRRGDALGLIGPNGIGKTTLLKILTGILPPDAGAMLLGTNIKLVSLEQNRDSLDPNLTLSDALNGGGSDMISVGGKQRHVFSYLKDFLFSPDQAKTPVNALSGGERGRLMLARAFAKKSNLLVLDEPTNDLDLETLDLLQEMLANYSGTVLLVSHDRDFLDRVVTSVIASEGDGHWVEYAGGYSDMISQGGTFLDKSGIEKKVRKRQKIEQKRETKVKLSYKEKYALEQLPKKIEALELDLKKYQQELSRPGLYSTDPVTFTKVVEKIGSLEQELASSEEEWLRLEILRDEIERN